MFSPNQRVKRLQAAIEKDGYNQGAHYMLGQEYLRDGRPMQAAAKFRRVTELNPDHARAWRMMGECYTACGILKEAAMAYETSAFEFDRQGQTEEAQAMRNEAKQTREAMA